MFCRIKLLLEIFLWDYTYNNLELYILIIISRQWFIVWRKRLFSICIFYKCNNIIPHYHWQNYPSHYYNTVALNVYIESNVYDSGSSKFHLVYKNISKRCPTQLKKTNMFSVVNIHDGCKMICILLTVKHMIKPLLYTAC